MDRYTMSRRFFLSSSGAFALAYGAGARGAAEEPGLRVGVLSDTHITDFASAAYLRRAFAFFRDAGVDAVVVAGDLTDHGLVGELRVFADAWREVFPDDRGLGGKHVEKVFIAGNHDVRVFDVYPCENANMGESDLDLGLCDDLPLVSVGFAKAWKHFFGEEFQPFAHKRVKGHDFLCASWDPNTPINFHTHLPGWQMRRFREEIAHVDTSKPFFYVQHPHLRGTVLYDNCAFTHDDGAMTPLLSDYPNAVAISGHSHWSLTDERSLWRGPFTAVAVPTLRKSVNISCIHDNHKAIVRNTANVEGVRQGLLVSVCADRVVMERRDFTRGEDVDSPWEVRLPAQREETSARREFIERPRFPAGAKIALTPPPKTGEDGFLKFPQALANAASRPYDYEVKVEHRYVGDTLTLGMFRLVNPTVTLPKRYDATVPEVAWKLESRYLPKYDLGDIRVSVTALNSLGGRGDTIVSEWVRVPNPKIF